jgi:hypothetical protein
VSYILFVVEAQFYFDGMIDARNSYSWSYDSSHEAGQENFQHTFLVNICCGIVGMLDICMSQIFSRE